MIRSLCTILCVAFIALVEASAGEPKFVPLFPEDGPVGKGWVVRHWADVKNEPDKKTVWEVTDGVLHGGLPRGTWLMSEKEYGDFELEFEFKLGPRGNSGCALRAPIVGDPAFDGMELQMADFRYNEKAAPSELTGGIYRAIAPLKQVYLPTAWNKYEISLKGAKLKVKLNGEWIQDVDLDKHDQVVKRHNGQGAPGVKDRPRRGRIGFQELSRDDSRVEIKGAKIKALD